MAKQKRFCSFGGKNDCMLKNWTRIIILLYKSVHYRSGAVDEFNENRVDSIISLTMRSYVSREKNTKLIKKI